MNILLVNNRFYPFGQGGAEKVVKILADQLHFQGHSVRVAAARPFFSKNPPSGRLPYQVDYLSSFYYYLGQIPGFLRLFYHVWNYISPFNFCRLRSIIRRFGPDLVITNNLLGLGALSVRLARGNKIKSLHILHDIQLLHPSGLMFWGREKRIESLPARAFQTVNRIIYRRAGIVVSPSEWLAGLYREKGFWPDKQIKVIKNPTDFKPLAPEEGRVEPTVLFVGNLNQAKGAELLLKAFKRARKKHKSLKLRFIGSNQLGRDFAEMLEKEAGVVFLGQQPPSKVRAEMASAGILAVPSLCYDNPPGVISEAKAVSLPVIAAAIGGIPELLDPERDILFEPGNSRDLAEKITGFFSGNWRARGLNRQALPPDPQKYTENLLKTINQL